MYAIPGSIHSPQSKGCHALLKQGGKLVETAQDILEETGGIYADSFAATPLTHAIDASQSDLLDLIGHDPVGIDELSARCNLTVSQLSAMLLALELTGSISLLPGGMYQRIN